MGRKKAPTTIIPVRWSDKEVAEIDNLAKIMSERSGKRITRSDVIRSYHSMIKTLYDPKLSFLDVLDAIQRMRL